MTPRRITIAAALLAVLGAWGFALSGDEPACGIDPVRVEAAVEGGTRDEALSRFRDGRSTHWRHVAVGNATSLR